MPSLVVDNYAVAMMTPGVECAGRGEGVRGYRWGVVYVRGLVRM